MLLQRFDFKVDDGRLLNISDGTGDKIAFLKNGHHGSLVKYVRKEETFTVLTKFKVRLARHFWDATTQFHPSGSHISGKLS